MLERGELLTLEEGNSLAEFRENMNDFLEVCLLYTSRCV